MFADVLLQASIPGIITLLALFKQKHYDIAGVSWLVGAVGIWGWSLPFYSGVFVVVGLSLIVAEALRYIRIRRAKSFKYE